VDVQRKEFMGVLEETWKKMTKIHMMDVSGPHRLPSVYPLTFSYHLLCRPVRLSPEFCEHSSKIPLVKSSQPQLIAWMLRLS
jgi:hypothetical protein